jgi:hypothetical protein
MRDPTTTTDTKWLIEVTIQYLCERNWQEMLEALNRSFAISRARFLRRPKPWGWRPPARKPGRPPQQRNLQIAGAIAMLVKDAGLYPTRSHFRRWSHSPSACAIVTAAVEQLSKYPCEYLEYPYERLNERTVEGIWDRYRRSPRLVHQHSTDYARNHYRRIVPNN